MASGWGAGRALRRHMGDSTLVQYAASNAFSGYDAALAAAEELQSLAAAARQIHLIRDRLAVVIAILQSLKSDQRAKIQAIISKKRAQWEQEAARQPWMSFAPEA